MSPALPKPPKASVIGVAWGVMPLQTNIPKRETGKRKGGVSKGFCLPREGRIRRSCEFKQIYARGRKIKGPHLTLYYLPNQLQETRLGLSVTKARFKLSTTRHFIQRRLREVFRLNKMRFLSGYDIVIGAQRFNQQRPGAEEVAKEVLFLAGKAGLLKKDA